MNGAASEITMRVVHRKAAKPRSSARHRDGDAVDVTQSISSQQSAASDEARDTVRVANASIDGSINIADRCIARHCIELHLARADEQADVRQA
jgi:hypothetical protein